MKFLYPPNTQDNYRLDLAGAASIRRNIWGNWNGYVGRRKVFEIGQHECDAERWMAERAALVAERKNKSK